MDIASVCTSGAVLPQLLWSARLLCLVVLAIREGTLPSPDNYVSLCHFGPLVEHRHHKNNEGSNHSICVMLEMIF